MFESAQKQLIQHLVQPNSCSRFVQWPVKFEITLMKFSAELLNELDYQMNYIDDGQRKLCKFFVFDFWITWENIWLYSLNVGNWVEINRDNQILKLLVLIKRGWSVPFLQAHNPTSLLLKVEISLHTQFTF